MINRAKLEHILEYARQQRHIGLHCKVPPEDMVEIVEMAMLQGAENRKSLPGIKAAPGLYSLARNADLPPGNSPVIPDCSCRTCRPVTFSDSRFVVCPECGNKRCPHANDHRNACTGSNEPGQEGSAYPAAPQKEVKP
ncbi:hypothetical protein [Escherichia coli]|uniref:hypothetical protein n=1 Tax=Escherichia coli TaxID=562 RepID=UPI003DA93316